MRAVLDPLQPDYDYIVVDCPPSLGLLTLNVLAAANTVLIPIQCEYYGLEGISQLLNTVRLVQQNFNPGLAISGVLLTMYDARLNLCRQVAEDAKEYFGAKMFVTPIPRNVRLAEAPSFGKPILLYDVQSVGAKSYLAVAQELIRRLEGAPSNERPRAAPTQPTDGVAALEAAAARAAADHSTTMATEEQSGSHEDAGAEDAVAESEAHPSADLASGAGASDDGASNAGAANDGASNDGASNDGASNDGASNDGASNDGAADEPEPVAFASADPASNPTAADESASEAVATATSPVAVQAAEATAPEGEAVGDHAGQAHDASATDMEPQQSQSHEPEVKT